MTQRLNVTINDKWLGIVQYINLKIQQKPGIDWTWYEVSYSYRDKGV